MIETALEEDLPEEFCGSTLRISAESKLTDNSKSTTPDKIDNNDASKINNNHYLWGTGFCLPSIASVPNRITETLWSSKNKEAAPTATTAPKTINSIQPSLNVNEDANNFFTFREVVVEQAIKDCTDQFLDLETEGPLLAAFLLTQINHWDTDKERLILITPKCIVLVKYDFIALKRLGCKKVLMEDVDQIIIGDLIYPAGSLIPRINGLADGVSNILEHCLFTRWSKNETKQLDNFYQPRDRNMKGIRIYFKGQPINIRTKWNPFNEDIPFWTLTFHPLYYHKDCTNEVLRNFYNLDSFIEKFCLSITDLKKNIDTSIILHSNILLESYVGLGSIIHNRNSLGFFKVRGKFSF